jgi:hypothetical protein
MSAESTQLLANIQAESKEGFPYILISPKRFKRIKQRKQEGRWNPRSDTVNTYDEILT